jgi:hypothetical protein
MDKNPTSFITEVIKETRDAQEDRDTWIDEWKEIILERARDGGTWMYDDNPRLDDMIYLIQDLKIHIIYSCPLDIMILYWGEIDKQPMWLHQLLSSSSPYKDGVLISNTPIDIKIIENAE